MLTVKMLNTDSLLDNVCYGYRGVGRGGGRRGRTPPFWGQILYISYSVSAEISAKIIFLKINI